MENPIRKILNNQNSEHSSAAPNEEQNKPHKKTWANGARQKCQEASGSPQILETCMEENFQKFKQECKDDNQRQAELKKPYLEKCETLKSKIKSQETKKEINLEEADEITGEITLINQQIAEVARQPEKFGIDVERKSKANFYIGLLLLIPITLYLLMFYISASYSAFFRDFSVNANIMQSIFDGQALTKAWSDPDNGGLINLVLVCTIPFVFMGLGYLIHMFLSSEEKLFSKIFKVFILLSITFIFDVLLAYYIDKKIFDTEKLPGEVYDINIAFQSVSFWIIIFAGFIVYVIWGFVFDFVMKEHANMDLINVFIRSKKKERKIKKNRYEELQKELQELKALIVDLEGKVEEISAKIDGFVFESKAYLLYHTEFLNHWNLEIGNVAMSQEKKEELLERCKIIGQNHLKTHQLTSTDTENIVYS